MHKQSLIHLHALLTELRQNVVERRDTSGDPFEEYDEFGVRAPHVHFGKDDHKRAVFLLLEGLNEAGEAPLEGDVQIASHEQ